jgi:hypothetical protein
MPEHFFTFVQKRVPMTSFTVFAIHFTRRYILIIPFKEYRSRDILSYISVKGILGELASISKNKLRALGGICGVRNIVGIL